MNLRVCNSLVQIILFEHKNRVLRSDIVKEVKVICPKCGHVMTYKNWFSWVWHTPFHWFDKRKVKCANCGESSYIKREK